MKSPLKRKIKLILIVLVVAAAAVGSYSIRRYHQAAPPFHNKQPAFSAAHTVGSIGIDNAPPVAAQPSLQGSTATSATQPSAGTAGTTSTGHGAKVHPLPQGGSNRVQGLRATSQDLQNAFSGILGL